MAVSRGFSKSLPGGIPPAATRGNPSAATHGVPSAASLFRGLRSDSAALAAAIALALGPLTVSAAAQPVDPGVLIQTIDLSAVAPPSPDPAGVVYLPALGSLLICDSEVNEMPLYQGANLWELSNGGEVLGTATTLAFSDEPTGVAFDPVSFHLFVSDDDDEEIFEVAAGPDGLFGTPDDQLTSFDTEAFGASDPEGVGYSTLSGHLFIVDGVGSEVYEVDPGPNGVFDGESPAGDDLISSFDVGSAGVDDPEGIVHDETTDTLLVADRNSKKIYEFAIGGGLLRTIDPGLGSGVRISGIAIAPASDNPMRRDLYVSDRAVDNNSNSNENDGKLYEIAVMPLTGNAPPTATAGTPQSVTGPSANVALAGAVNDDGYPLPPNTLTVGWSQMSGPGVAVFDDPADPETDVTLPVVGSYVLQLQASDGSLVTSDEVVITVASQFSCGLGPELAGLLSCLAGLRGRARALGGAKA